MDTEKITIKLKIRRYDSSPEHPEIVEKLAEFDRSSDYNDLKKEIQELCEISAEDNKVIKLRKEDEVLVPLSFLLESKSPEKYFYIDVCRINYTNKATASLLQDAYIDSVCQKLRNMDARIVRAEQLLPQLEWRRQAHLEDTVSGLSSRVSFLNRRIDELLPAQWRSKMPQTMA